MIAIAAVDEGWGLGYGGDQTFYIAEDLDRFRALTRGKTVIAGRKTVATFPGGRPLPGRRNLILSRDPAYRPEGAEVCSNLQMVRERAEADACVIGGASVYEALLADCDRVLITKVQGHFPADCWFPNLDQDPAWEAEWTSQLQTDGTYNWTYVNYRRK